jgi:hypothetical protein
MRYHTHHLLLKKEKKNPLENEKADDKSVTKNALGGLTTLDSKKICIFIKHYLKMHNSSANVDPNDNGHFPHWPAKSRTVTP